MKSHLLSIMLVLMCAMVCTSAALAGVVAYWPLNEGSGQAVSDASGNGNDAHLGDSSAVEASDPAWRVDGTRGNVLEFGGYGSPDWINLSDHISNFADLQQGTIVFWGNVTADLLETVIAASDSTASNNGTDVFLTHRWTGGNKNIGYYYRTRTATPHASGDVRTGIQAHSRWTHIAVTSDASGSKIYQDGVLSGQGAHQFFSTVPGLNNMQIGRMVRLINPGGTWFMNGLLSDIAIFDEALPSGAIEFLYDGMDILNPDAVLSATPADGAESVPVDILLEWEPPGSDPNGNPYLYNVYFDTDPNFQPEVSHEQAETFYSPTTELDTDTIYYWRVDVVGSSRIGLVWMFKTQPPKVILPDPADGATNVARNAVLSWTSAPGALSHNVYFGTDQALVTNGDASVYLGNFTEISFDPDLDWQTQYFWRVDEVFNGGPPDSGDVWTFTVGTPTCNPPLLADTNGDCLVKLDDFIQMGIEWLSCTLVNDDCP